MDTKLFITYCKWSVIILIITLIILIGLSAYNPNMVISKPYCYIIAGVFINTLLVWLICVYSLIKDAYK